jgi:hypothetical protein
MVADFRMDPQVVDEYSTLVAQSAAKLSPNATDRLKEASLTVDSFGELAQDLEVLQAYERAKESFTQNLATGSAALRSASESLRNATAQHTGNEEDVLSQLNKASEL